jgi:hypothetical protein
MPDRVGVFDSSAAIDLRNVPVGEVRRVVDELVAMTEAGLIAFPEQVYRECCVGKRSDFGSLFIFEARQVLQHPEEVDSEILAEVQDDEVGSQLTPANTTNPHHADVYVVALAIQLERTHRDVTVVCNENPENDKPHDVTVPTGCQRFGVTWLTLDEFLRAEGLL